MTYTELFKKNGLKAGIQAAVFVAALAAVLKYLAHIPLTIWHVVVYLLVFFLVASYFSFRTIMPIRRVLEIVTRPLVRQQMVKEFRMFEYEAQKGKALGFEVMASSYVTGIDDFLKKDMKMAYMLMTIAISKHKKTKDIERAKSKLADIKADMTAYEIACAEEMLKDHRAIKIHNGIA